MRQLADTARRHFRVWQARRAVVRDVVDGMCEGLEKRPAELYDMIGMDRSTANVAQVRQALDGDQ